MTLLIIPLGAALIKTIVASFDGYRSAQEVVRKLTADGFMASDISILASNASGDYGPDARVEVADTAGNTATGAVTGGLVGGAAGFAASLAGLAIPGIGPIIAAGPLVATLSGAGAGVLAGGLIGALTEVGVSEEHAGYYAESVRRGGTLVTVKADESRADRVAQIMRDTGAVDIEQRVSRWREDGWEGWNPDAGPYSRAEAERERQLYGADTDPLSGLPSTSDPERDPRRPSTIRR